MNAFANALFSVLFSGVRSVIESVWSAVAAGKLSGFFSWLGDHWLPLVAVLCLFGTLADFLIWLIRWRPYLVWNTELRHLFSRSARKQAEADWRFTRGYQSGIELDMTDLPAPVAEADWDDQALWEQQEALSQPQKNEEFFPPYVQENQPNESYYAPQQEWASPISEPPEQPETVDFLPPQLQQQVWPSPSVESTAQRNPRRNRNAAQGKKRFSLHEHLTAQEQDDEGMLDGLPPAVDRQQAFHEPVYPNRKFSSSAASWQRPNQKNG